jgi:molecular chaperone Hsp33
MQNLVRMMDENGVLCVLAVDSTEIVREMHALHNTSKVVSAALGRLLTGASLMGSMLKGEQDTITLNIRADGPCSPLTAVSDSRGFVRGYAGKERVDLPLNGKGKLDVSGAVGKNGTLTVVKDLGLREPYVGQVPLVSGEIAEDITAYYAASEQTPTVCALGVLTDKETEEILCAGGFMIQLLPTAMDEDIDKVEKGLQNIRPVTTMLFEGMTPEQICRAVLPEFKLSVLDTAETRYFCPCSRERMERALLSTGKQALSEMAEDEQTEVTCNFCNRKYVFTKAEMLALLKSATDKS